MSNRSSIRVVERIDIPAGAPPDLPVWAAALPLWAGASWLWITAGPEPLLHYQRGDAEGPGPEGTAGAWTHLPLAPAYPLLVLDCRLAPMLPSTCWPILAEGLAPGGVLFVCGPRRPGLPAAIRAAAPSLRPAAWHLIVPRQDAAWYLRPAATSFRRLLNRQLDPAYSTRAWLTQVARILRPAKDRIPCLPVWRA